MQFSQIAGQSYIKVKLVHLVSKNRLSHALLFLERDGSGALQLALALAQYVVCQKNKPSDKPANDSLFADPTPVQTEFLNDSCGVCPSCLKAAALVHPDIHFSFPTITIQGIDKPKSSYFIVQWRDFIEQTPYGNSFDWLQSIGAENKQGNITAHECEDILRKLNLKSFESGYKILIQWMPEYLGNIGNKLLKMIEEPPPNTLFILVAEDESKIISTILSRTQLVKINRIEQDEIEKWLTAKHAVPKEKSITIASIADGNMREALHLLNHADEDWFDLLREWLNAILKNGPASQIKWIDDISKLGREKQKQFLLYFIQVLEHAIRLRISGALENPQSAEIQATQVDFAGKLNKICYHSQQEAIIRELDQAYYQIERNANAKILFHALTIRLYHIISNNSVILMQ
jgi:DNA polymerase-3 subunit delta'